MQSTQRVFLAAIALAGLAGHAAAAPVTVTSTSVFRDHEGPNTIGTGTGDNLTVVVRDVRPNLTTRGAASNPQYAGQVSLLNLFTSPFSFFARTFGNDAPGAGGTVTAPWTVTLQNRTDTLAVTTNSMVGVGQLPLLNNLAVTGSALAPTLGWDAVNTSTPYSQVRLSIYDDRSDRALVVDQLIGGPNLTSYTVPIGTLAPNGQYAFRVFLWDNGPDGFLLNRSSTHVNHTTTSAAVNAGAVVRNGAGVLSAPLTLNAGANVLPNQNVGIGNGGRGAARLDAGTTLSSQFLNVGTNNLGTLVVSGTTVTLDGGTFNDGTNPPDTNGGFLTVGRVSGGRGFMDVINGGQVLVNSNGQLSPGINIGRDAGSAGVLSIEGAGSQVVVTGPAVASPTLAQNGAINVGRSGDGILNVLAGGKLINDAEGIINIGRDAGSRGNAVVSGAGSLLNAGAQLNVGLAGGGEGILRVANGAHVVAGMTTIGPGGMLTGSGGFLFGGVRVLGGVISPGSSPGTLVVVGDLDLADGLLLLEAFGDSPDQIDHIDVQGRIVIGAQAQIEIMLGFNPSSPLSFLSATDGIEIDPDFAGPQVFALAGGDVPGGGTVAIDIGGRRFDVVVQAAVPAPGTLGLIALALAALSYIANGRRRRA